MMRDEALSWTSDGLAIAWGSERKAWTAGSSAFPMSPGKHRTFPSRNFHPLRLSALICSGGSKNVCIWKLKFYLALLKSIKCHLLVLKRTNYWVKCAGKMLVFNRDEDVIYNPCRRLLNFFVLMQVMMTHLHYCKFNQSETNLLPDKIICSCLYFILHVSCLRLIFYDYFRDTE